MRVDKIRLTPAGCAVDLGDGSERGLYVNQDYILHKLGRPMRGINLMYCYYPYDETWPMRSSEAYKDMEVHGAWDYPYDDYFPYRGGVEGDTNGEPFTCMQDVRRHGQDVVLTMTIDPGLDDERIIQIAKDLRPYGRMMLRLNHEASGDWFEFTKRASYAEIGDFFVRFKRLMQQYAPNVKMILCIEGFKNPADKEVPRQADFEKAIEETDFWSIDQYIALNWGWPYEVAEADNFQHQRSDATDVFNNFKRTYKHFKSMTGQDKKILMSELNADGDVTGQYDQCDLVREFVENIKNDSEQGWCGGFTLYQFRDDGRLGLEFTDPNNSSVGIEQPLMKTFKEIIHDDYFRPGIEVDGNTDLPIRLRWGGSEDAEGISMELDFESAPIFAELNFPEELVDANLMMEIGGTWFYKASGVKYIDMMSAFYNSDFAGGKLRLNIFAPPASGKNDETQGEDWDINYYYDIKALPDVRLRFKPIVEGSK